METSHYWTFLELLQQMFTATSLFFYFGQNPKLSNTKVTHVARKAKITVCAHTHILTVTLKLNWYLNNNINYGVSVQFSRSVVSDPFL